ncbi:hypothetical protein BN14_07116 [Rhizoctonia solani AG-1 IB]|uniref:Uncharacterized protein n=1 Tax=Thanatephorus cucumeris (strain AG1-IB / isolate 7/3/14) TaxID=1108050 RepID=M5CB50_THACB|nr:hypothetical protein BN14_07116 [Rhizoctonia solani AG-1 IB]
MPEPIQAGSIIARDDDDVDAEDGLGGDDGLVARGDKGHDYCWNKHGWDKCSKWGYCCKKEQTCCGDNKCCGKGFRCKRTEYHDGHHKRGDDDHHGSHHNYHWVCTNKGHHW